MRRPDALIVLQARLGSTRLPSKAMRRLEGYTLVERCLLRLLAGHAAPVILATTTRREDDVLVREAERCGVTSVRGSRDDVLGRFALAASLLQPRYIIRATADNPAVDIDAPGRVLALLRAQPVDYVVEHGLPCGGAVEGVRTEALLDAAERTDVPYDREHVTPYVKDPANGYRVLDAQAPERVRRPDLRFSIDTPDDLVWMERVFARAGAAAPTLPLTLLIRAADALSLREVA